MCSDPMHLTHRVTGRGLSRLSLARPPSFPLSLSLSLSQERSEVASTATAVACPLTSSQRQHTHKVSSSSVHTDTYACHRKRSSLVCKPSHGRASHARACLDGWKLDVGCTASAAAPSPPARGYRHVQGSIDGQPSSRSLIPLAPPGPNRTLRGWSPLQGGHHARKRTHEK